MPIFGQLETSQHLARAPVVTAPLAAEDEFAVDGVDILAFTAEIDIERGFAVTPKALHPSLPSYCQIVLRRHPGGPFGPFTLAELRLNTRAGTNYVGYCLGAFTDNANAASFFTSRYGAHVQVADVRVARTYYDTEGSVTLDGQPVIRGRLQTPGYISGSDVLYTPNLNLAVMNGEAVLVHQEMEYTIGKAQRGHPVIEVFDAAAFGDSRVVLRHHLPATLTDARVSYTRVRYLIDPEQAAMTGTRPLAA